MILNLRGPGGSGKTYVHRHLIDAYLKRSICSPDFRGRRTRKAISHELSGGLYVVGRYTPGADGIRFEPLMDLVRAFAPLGHVFFENVMVSGNANAWLALRREMPDQEWVWATIDTPFELCLERIYSRNGGKPIKEGVAAAHFRRVHRAHAQLEEAGEKTVWIDHTRAYDQVHEILTAGGWRP